MKQTSVEFAVEKLEKFIPSGNQIAIFSILQQAKQMEKEQMIAFANDVSREILNENIHSPFSIEQYYNETYNK